MDGIWGDNQCNGARQLSNWLESGPPVMGFVGAMKTLLYSQDLCQICSVARQPPCLPLAVDTGERAWDWHTPRWGSPSEGVVL